MGTRFFSDKHRPSHLGPYPLERLARQESAAELSHCPEFRPLSFERPDEPFSIVNAMADHQAMLDAIRDGQTNVTRAGCPDDLTERANHLKAFAYFADASMVGTCLLPKGSILEHSVRNPSIAKLAEALRSRQTKTLAAGIDLIMADLRDSINAPESSIQHHTHALVCLYEFPRDPDSTESGTQWIQNAQQHRACLLASETAIVLANYIRLLGYDARAHTGTTSDVCLNQLCVAAGLATVEQGELYNPYLKSRFGISVVTSTFATTPDQPLKPMSEQPTHQTHGFAWKLGKGFAKSQSNQLAYSKRRYVDGPFPFEKLNRTETPTTYIDEANVARVPKRADMFARANFGDMGQKLQRGAKGGHYVRKSAPSMAQRRALGAFVLLQDGEAAAEKQAITPLQASQLVKASSYFLGADAMGVSRCPDWAWYSHDAHGNELKPPHDQAISMVIDQGYNTMEGSSGDDWIAVSQSMRAYLRFSLIGGVIATQLRRLGYKAKAHSVMDGEVLQPPLLLLSGLGEVSRIGEVILNPFLGPRLKSGAITTDLQMEHDKPIDFGLQHFCENCNKCARECPSGAITAGPKLMFNGYEIWKSDSQKCASYRINTIGGAMCGRCMKTCPWNLEGLFQEKPFRWAAMNFPLAAKALAKFDDVLERGSLNPTKKWWWDLEMNADGAYMPATDVNTRTLQRDLHLKYEDQTLAVYPANLAPHPYPYPYPMDREKGIQAYKRLITAAEYRKLVDAGDTQQIEHRYTAAGDSPVLQVEIIKLKKMCENITLYQLASVDGSQLPTWTAGAHIDIVIAPEYLRQYSLCGDPQQRTHYEVAVLHEAEGRGGSALMERIFSVGRKLFISPPLNHFSLVKTQAPSVLMGGGIGVTPLIAMAHELNQKNAAFTLHYSGRSRDTVGFLDELENQPWASKVQLHISEEGTRANFESIFNSVPANAQIYICGSEPYMQAVTHAAIQAEVNEEQLHLEYFSVPETPEWVNRPFQLKLQQTGLTLDVPADKTATDILNMHGLHVDVKCSDGLCGVCKCSVIEGDVEHRDFVLSKQQQKNHMILCQSRAQEYNGMITIDL